MNPALKVILIGVSRNPERVVVIMYDNVEVISQTYKDIPSENCIFDNFNYPNPV